MSMLVIIPNLEDELIDSYYMETQATLIILQMGGDGRQFKCQLSTYQYSSTALSDLCWEVVRLTTKATYTTYYLVVV